jgi:hypothetical protein
VDKHCLGAVAGDVDTAVKALLNARNALDAQYGDR